MPQYLVSAAMILVAMLMMASVSPTGQGPKHAQPKAGTRDLPAAKMFTGSNQCMACHNDLETEDGQHVSIGADWRASMMAHASIDPYWQAGVRRETIDHPAASNAIQDECSKCHMPMSRYRSHQNGEKGRIFDHLPPTTEQPGIDAQQPASSSQLAAEGVSCVTCHQIMAENLGTEESFTGGFEIDSRTPPGEREIYGPYDVDAGRKTAMKSASSFIPVRHEHIQNSSLCASCHTLYTHTLDEDGDVVGELPEQMPYLEWLHSDYPDRESCQDCHMPELDEPMQIASVLGQDRDNFSRHSFRGGNFFMLRVLRKYADELNVTATPEELQSTIDATLKNLRTQSAEIAIEDLRTTPDGIEFAVNIRNLAGHKLPTAYPSRRVWLNVTVTDQNGRTLFESGALRPDGSIVGNANDEDPRLFEPHHATIRRSDQVQIYEAIMATPEGKVTTGLLSAIRFIKDNRVLPTGFVKETADADIKVHGNASKDKDFTGGQDRVRYQISTDEPEQAHYQIHAVLWYQPVAYRWARNLDRYDSMETRRFVRYYNDLSDRSAVQLVATNAVTEKL